MSNQWLFNLQHTKCLCTVALSGIEECVLKSRVIQQNELFMTAKNVFIWTYHFTSSYTTETAQNLDV